MPNNVIRLLRIEEFRGTLKVLESGLRIGGSKDSVGIGETDNPIIRHPITNLPYIPGSSLKGKLRSLLELVDCPTTQATGR
ncbi:MAG: RAMP superfamily CRISPR-associated protein, partial [Planctomycetota bacterium]|nr:RAMP superfamily CRISPR-associated protein [Planctomycetota bacterium]